VQFLQIFKANPNHGADGRFSSGGDLASDERGKIPTVGSKFIVYRLGSPNVRTLDNRNAGNAVSVASHIANVQGDDGPISSTGAGDTIHAFEVTTTKGFSGYQRSVGGLTLNEFGVPKTVTTVGRIQGTKGQVAYSFPKDGAYTAKYLGSVPLSEMHEHLQTAYGMKNFDDAGYTLGGKAIREVFAKHIGAENV
jgi:hypothetical protein